MPDHRYSARTRLTRPPAAGVLSNRRRYNSGARPVRQGEAALARIRGAFVDGPLDPFLITAALVAAALQP
jgi:hypothetical protein